MNKKLIIFRALSTLMGAVLGYCGVLWYGDNISRSIVRGGNEVKEDIFSNSVIISSKLGKKKKLSLEEILKKNDSYDKRGALQTYYDFIRLEEWEEEWQKILVLDRDQRNQVLSEFFSSWGRQEPRRALLATEALSDSFDRQIAHDHVFRAWAERNPEEAAVYFGENEGLLNAPSLFMVQDVTGSMSGAGCSIVTELAKIAPEKALTWIGNLEDDKLKNSLKQHLANILAEKDPLALLKNKAQLFQGEEKITYAAIAGQWAKRDPVAAQQWVESLPEEERKKSHQTIVSLLSEINPRESLAWAEKNLDIRTISEDKNNSIMSNLRTLESDEAMSWIQGFPDSSEKYKLMQDYASYGGGRDYIKKVEFVTQIPDKGARNDAMVRVLSKWKKDDDASQKKWLDAASFNKEDKDFILKEMKYYE